MEDNAYAFASFVLKVVFFSSTGPSAKIVKCTAKVKVSNVKMGLLWEFLENAFIVHLAGKPNALYKH